MEPTKAQTLAALGNAVAVFGQVINDYGTDSPEAESARKASRQAAVAARVCGATDEEMRAARPG